MTPAARAVADRFILDTANVKYVAEYLPRGAGRRVVARTGWTVTQTIGHLALEMTDLAEAINELTAGAEQSPTGVDRAAVDAEHARISAKWSAKELIRRLDAGLVAVTGALAKLDEVPQGSMVGGRTMDEALDSTHAAAHGLELSEALEEMRFDPMMLNWLLAADFSGKPQLFDRQRKLFEEARAYFRALGEDDDEDDDDEEAD
jgi:hypothetical protein